MKFFLIVILGGVLLVFLPALGFGYLLTSQLEHSPQQRQFLVGTLPSPAPNGPYHGSVNSHSSSGNWLGKSFTATTSAGINIFRKEGTGGGETRAYPFATEVGKGLRDKELDVLKIEYDLPGNPFWLRMILDEVVQVAPDRYLGKMHVRLIPGWPFTFTFFELRKTAPNSISE